MDINNESGAKNLSAEQEALFYTFIASPEFPAIQKEAVKGLLASEVGRIALREELEKILDGDGRLLTREKIKIQPNITSKKQKKIEIESLYAISGMLKELDTNNLTIENIGHKESMECIVTDALKNSSQATEILLEGTSLPGGRILHNPSIIANTTQPDIS